MTTMQPDSDHGRHLLREMLRIRRFEEKCAEFYSAGKIRGFLHLYIGEEAVAVGVMQTLGPDDAVVATYRTPRNSPRQGPATFLEIRRWTRRGVIRHRFRSHGSKRPADGETAARNGPCHLRATRHRLRCPGETTLEVDGSTMDEVRRILERLPPRL